MKIPSTSSSNAIIPSIWSWILSSTSPFNTIKNYNVNHSTIYHVFFIHSHHVFEGLPYLLLPTISNLSILHIGVVSTLLLTYPIYLKQVSLILSSTGAIVKLPLTHFSIWLYVLGPLSMKLWLGISALYWRMEMAKLIIGNLSSLLNKVFLLMGGTFRLFHLLAKAFGVVSLCLYQLQ